MAAITDHLARPSNQGKTGRLLKLAGALLLGTVVQGLIAMGALGWVEAGADQVYRESLLPTACLTDIRVDVGMITTNAATLRFVNSDQQLAQLRTEIAQAEADLDTRLADYQQAAGVDRREQVERFTTAWRRWREVRDTQLYPRVDAGQKAQVEALFINEVIPAVAAAQQGLGDLAATEALNGRATTENTHKYYYALQATLVLLLLLVLAAEVRFVRRLTQSGQAPADNRDPGGQDVA